MQHIPTTYFFCPGISTTASQKPDRHKKKRCAAILREDGISQLKWPSGLWILMRSILENIFDVGTAPKRSWLTAPRSMVRVFNRPVITTFLATSRDWLAWRNIWSTRHQISTGLPMVFHTWSLTILGAQGLRQEDLKQAESELTTPGCSYYCNMAICHSSQSLASD